jgi:hypothetical protein
MNYHDFDTNMTYSDFDGSEKKLGDFSCNTSSNTIKNIFDGFASDNSFMSSENKEGDDYNRQRNGISRKGNYKIRCQIKKKFDKLVENGHSGMFFFITPGGKFNGFATDDCISSIRPDRHHMENSIRSIQRGKLNMVKTTKNKLNNTGKNNLNWMIVPSNRSSKKKKKKILIPIEYGFNCNMPKMSPLVYNKNRMNI